MKKRIISISACQKFFIFLVFYFFFLIIIPSTSLAETTGITSTEYAPYQADGQFPNITLSDKIDIGNNDPTISNDSEIIIRGWMNDWTEGQMPNEPRILVYCKNEESSRSEGNDYLCDSNPIVKKVYYQITEGGQVIPIDEIPTKAGFYVLEATIEEHASYDVKNWHHFKIRQRETEMAPDKPLLWSQCHQFNGELIHIQKDGTLGIPDSVRKEDMDGRQWDGVGLGFTITPTNGGGFGTQYNIQNDFSKPVNPIRVTFSVDLPNLEEGNYSLQVSSCHRAFGGCGYKNFLNGYVNVYNPETGRYEYGKYNVRYTALFNENGEIIVRVYWLDDRFYSGEVPENIEKEITFPRNLSTIGAEAFRGDFSLQNVIIPYSVNKIGDFAFADCKNLRDVTIPASVVNL